VRRRSAGCREMATTGPLPLQGGGRRAALRWVLRGGLPTAPVIGYKQASISTLTVSKWFYAPQLLLPGRPVLCTAHLRVHECLDALLGQP
jgi:hypothetical protein